MKTLASLKAYYNKDNQKVRLLHRELIQKVFEETTQAFTTRNIADITGLSYNSCQKRISELDKATIIFVSGEKEESGNMNSLYKFNKVPSIFDKKKMTKFELMKLAIKKSLLPHEAEAIFNEYERMKKRMES